MAAGATSSPVEKWSDTPQAGTPEVWTDTQPAAKQDHSAFTDALKEYWAKVQGPRDVGNAIIGAVRHPVDTVRAYGQQTGGLLDKAEESFKKGDYAEGVRHGLSFLLNGLPGVGAAVDEAGNKAQSGDYAGAAADTAALATNIAAAKYAPAAATKIAEGVEAAPRAVATVAAKPIVGKTIGGGIGAAIGHATGIPEGGIVGGLLGREVGSAASRAIGKSIAPEAKAAAPAAAVIDPLEALHNDLALSMTKKPFAKLDAASQEAIRNIAAKIQSQESAPAARALVPAEQPVAAPTAKPLGAEPSPTVIPEDATAAGNRLRPDWRQEIIDKLNTPQTKADLPQPANTVTAPHTAEQGPAIPTKYAANKSALAKDMAEHMVAKGLPWDLTRKVSPGDSFWSKVYANVRDGKVYQPKPDTIQLALEHMKALEDASGGETPAPSTAGPGSSRLSGRALDIAQRLAQEIGQ